MAPLSEPGSSGPLLAGSPAFAHTERLRSGVEGEAVASSHERSGIWSAGTPASSATGGHVQPEATGPLFDPVDEVPPERAEAVATGRSPRRTPERSASRTQSDSGVASRPVRTDVIPRAAPSGRYASPSPRYRPAVRRVKRTLRHVDPISVLKLSFVYYACVLVVGLVFVAVVYWLLESAGLFRTIEEIQTAFELEQNFRITLGFLEKWTLIIGFALVVLGSFLNVLLAFIYNLAADVSGGIEMTFSERDD